MVLPCATAETVESAVLGGEAIEGGWRLGHLRIQDLRSQVECIRYIQVE